jgi:hypothetical protein
MLIVVFTYARKTGKSPIRKNPFIEKENQVNQGEDSSWLEIFTSITA